jgi:retron-type reverse transcriptase
LTDGVLGQAELIGPLSIPSIRDRIVQAAVKIVLEADLRG